ncbi:wtf antidote-like meiotic drive suppressor Wtf18 [Schizosaccharomyces pombe]|uniref:Meiotic drive suppressor wtf18 n=1 Tax=Schizosaccharomyces pombe (strain 972 / ATCC 24843) TaxID=284812 RepID=WTF18_SCHPO|nr:RecName: Full=Meiotic drive suppressor wtf18 [Schizosaccharomyces pombe 972h-]
MKNNYTSLKSPLDEEDELKTDHEIDLEKGLLPEYNSEEEGTLPLYSDISKLANPVPEDSSTGPTEIANPNVERRQEFKDSHPNIYFLLRLLISVLAVSVVFFTAWVCVNPLEKSIFGKVAFSVTIGITCPILFIATFCFFETWTQAVAQCIKVTVIFLAQCVKVTVIFLAQCVKVTAVFLAKCVKVIAVGLYNSKKDLVVTIWLAWVVICFILFGCVKDGRLNLNKALICSTCSISAALFFILLLVCIPIWTLKHMLFGLFQVLGVQSCVVIVTKGLMYLFDKHIDATGYEIEASSLFVIGNFLFFYEMECPGALKRMPKFIRNGIASFLEGIGNAFGGIGNAIGRIGNAFRGANDNNNNIPLEETEAESEV